MDASALLSQAMGRLKGVAGWRLRHVDEAAEAVSRGLSRADEVAEAVVDIERAASHTDETIEAVVEAGRGVNYLDESGSLGRSFDNFSPSCSNSFTAGTPIETDQGQKPIEAIQIGDKVLAEDQCPYCLPAGVVWAGAIGRGGGAVAKRCCLSPPRFCSTGGLRDEAVKPVKRAHRRALFLLGGAAFGGQNPPG